MKKRFDVEQIVWIVRQVDLHDIWTAYAYPLFAATMLDVPFERPPVHIKVHPARPSRPGDLRRARCAHPRRDSRVR